MLAAGAAGAHRIDADILGTDVEIDILHLRQHRNRRCRGVDAAACLRGRNSLDAVDAKFVLEASEHALSGDRAYDFLEAAQIVLRQADDFGLPAALLGVSAIHAEEVGGEQRRLVAACAGPHFQDRALLVGGVLREKMHAQLLQEAPPAVVGLAEFLVAPAP